MLLCFLFLTSFSFTHFFSKICSIGFFVKNWGLPILGTKSSASWAALMAFWTNRQHRHLCWTTDAVKPNGSAAAPGCRAHFRDLRSFPWHRQVFRHKMKGFWYVFRWITIWNFIIVFGSFFETGDVELQVACFNLSKLVNLPRWFGYARHLDTRVH